jgi:hypothetical protein
MQVDEFVNDAFIPTTLELNAAFAIQGWPEELETVTVVQVVSLQLTPFGLVPVLIRQTL